MYITVYDKSIEVLASNAELPDFGKMNFYFDDNYYLEYTTLNFDFSEIAKENVELADYLMSVYKDIPNSIIDGYVFSCTSYAEDDKKLSKEEMIRNVEDEYILHYVE